MKTIAFNRSRGSMFTTVFVLGALGALYYYRRSGGKMSELFSGILGGAGMVRGKLGDALENIGAGDQTTSRYGRGDEISKSPESMDSLPAT
jgi:hypothetical protein